VKNFLHIVCLEVPWPADSGASIDMMNRIMMLKKLDIGIHLHYFNYDECGNPNELNQYCETINVYERKACTRGLSLHLPYIISSLTNDRLVANLQKDDHPILLEGIHCTGILSHFNTGKRRIVVRMHNEENIYCKELPDQGAGFLRKLYFYNENRLLKKYKHQLPADCVYACISQNEISSLKKEYALDKVEFLPAFPGWQKVSGQEGIGNLCLYHGNLSVPENEEAALWLLCKVFTRIRVPFVIAGKKPSRRLQKMAHLCQHTCLVADPTETEMDDLIKKAHINVLPSFNKNSTGTHLKLLHALYQGRHCVVNDPMVEGTGLEAGCHIGTNANAFASIITQLYHQPFGEDEIRLRKRLLYSVYDNEKNTKQLIQWLW
jgi:hypothetical protein